MDRLDAAQAEAERLAQEREQERQAEKTCPECSQSFKGTRVAWWRKHLLTCGHEPAFTPAPWEPHPVAECRECHGPCTPAHRRRLRAQRQHSKAA